MTRALKKKLCTIGYEQAPPAAVLDELTRAKVDILIDVRAVAASRRPGFSKRQLAAALDERGIAYLHLQKLGTPKEGRHAARAGDAKTMLRIYEAHLKTEAAQEELAELIALVKSGKRACLLCYERNPNECHRTRLAELVRAKTRVAVDDLIPKLF